MSKYHHKRITVREHTRFDPRIKKRVSVDSYPRNQRYRNYETVSQSLARRSFNQRSERAKAIDLSKTSKKVFDDPNESWLENIGRSDVKGIDTKTKKETKTKPIVKKSIGDFSEKEWKNISLNEKMDITDKVYDNEIIINLKNSIEQIEKRVELSDKNVAWAYQKDLPKETKDKLNKNLRDAEKDLKIAKDQLKEKVEYLRKKFTREYISKNQKKLKPLKDQIEAISQELDQKIIKTKKEIETLKRKPKTKVLAKVEKTKLEDLAKKFTNKEKWEKNTTKMESFGGSGIKSKDNIALVVDSDSIKTSEWYNHITSRIGYLKIKPSDKDIKSITQKDIDYIQLPTSDLLYRKDYYEDAIQNFKSPEIHLAANSPVIIEGKEKSMVIAPFISGD